MSKNQPADLTTIGTAINDPVSWAQAVLLRIGLAFQSVVNEFLAVIQFVFEPTNATGSYEKDGIAFFGETRDPSSYPSDPAKWITKDAVSVDSRMRIRGGIKTGRGWAHYMEVGCDADSDGMLIGVELGGANMGPAQPQLDQINSKNLLMFVAGEEVGASHMTSASITASAQGARFFNGHIANRNAFVDENNAPVWAVRNDDGSILSAMYSGGGIRGYYLPRFVNTKGLDPSLIQPPSQPGEFFMWGDLNTGSPYLAFNNGGMVLLWPMGSAVPLK